MGGMTSLAAQAFQVLGAVNTALGAVDSFSQKSGKADYEAQKRVNALALQNAQVKAGQEQAKITLEAEKVESERRDALRRAVARQRAISGASGTGSGGGSAQAVLLGLVNESQEQLEQRTALDNLRKAGTQEDVAAQGRINTLQLTQLRERDKYNRYTAGYGLANALQGLND